MDYSKKCLSFAIFTGVLIGLMTFVSAFFAPSLFTEVSAAAKATARNLLFLYAATAVLRNIAFMAVIGILRSGGDTTFCMISETLAIWFVSIPLVFFGGLVMGWNIYVLYMLSNVSEIIKAIFFITRIRGGKWLKFVAEH